MAGRITWRVAQNTLCNSNGRSQYYRAQTTFKRVTKWLRAHGVTGQKPLHTLRKEFGSIICAGSDIHTASRQLRHKHIGTTAAHYTDNRRRDTVPVGTLLTVAASAETQTNQLQLPLFEHGKK